MQNIDQNPETPNRYNQPSPDSMGDSVGSSADIPLDINRASDLLMAVSAGAEVNKAKIMKLAVSAMEELKRKALAGEPLWQRQVDGVTEILNEVEYVREFRNFDLYRRELMRMAEMGEPQPFQVLHGSDQNPWESRFKPTFRRAADNRVLRIEASREIGFVSMNATSLVQCLTDLKQWSSVFSNIVSGAALLRCLSPAVGGNYDETLQVMRAEFHVPSPLVRARECQFARYCKYLGTGTWGVVDISLESLLNQPVVSFWRRPSGCLIQQMPNGYSKIIWVEHAEVDDGVIHGIFQPHVLSGFAFCARRWIYTMIRHCEGLAALTSENPLSTSGVLIPKHGKASLLMLAERMTRNFCLDITASTNSIWMSFSEIGDEDFRVRAQNINPIPGMATRTVVFASSLLLPVPPKRVFDFLWQADNRNQWDLLAHNHVVSEPAHIIKGENPENRISIIQVNSGPNKTEIFYLQESYSDGTGLYVVYAPVDIGAMTNLVRGGNPDYVNILPSGFVVHPIRPVINGDEVGGCLLTLAFHIIDNSATGGYISSGSARATYRILAETAASIKQALSIQ